MFAEFNTRKGKSQARTLEESFKEIDAAEAVGMDSVWLAEDHFNPENSIIASPFTVAGAVAVRTSRVRIGMGVVLLPLRNPVQVAEEASTVDLLSHGRLDVGVGRSPLLTNYRGFNIPYEEAQARLLEALEVIKRAWTEDPFSHQGRFWTFGDVTLVPKPLQTPHPPIWFAASSEESFPLAGKMGYPILVPSVTGIPKLVERVRVYRKAWHQAGHPGQGAVMLRIPAYAAETAARARSEPEASTMHKVQLRARLLLANIASEDVAREFRRDSQVSYDDILRDSVMYGTPEAIVERIQEHEDRMGISGVILETNLGGQVPTDRVVKSLRLLAEKVMPEFK
jgi:alkanesulfonate monooxygenase SsuD/methylene tetrahydromethanopterin reductase-like flavin-dependent oxidoreductase (luciferase family)